ncbi:MAG: hypothetical protein Q9186_002631 [Xanthomendoza sp. 1 TL-2023]
MALYAPLTTLPIDIIIRFALSIPDLPLTIPSPTTTTPLHLLHDHIRPYLPPTYRSCPIRLIASGALLPRSKPLSTCLRLPPSPPPRTAKGKEKEPPPAPPIYIHCSISTTQTLSASALAAEAASFTDTIPPPVSDPDTPPSPHDALSEQHQHHHPEPLGFDRLLTAGLTHLEIASLRSQFLALTAHTHTPDTMPSPASMRRLEERWLDSSGPSSSNYPNAFINGTRTNEHEDDDAAADDDERGALDDLLWGNLMGFFWPLGAALWLIREDGVWSKRRQMSVVTGLMMNMVFGVLRMGLG